MRVVKRVRAIWQPKAQSYYPRSSPALLTEAKKADPRTSPKIMATERTRQKPPAFLLHNFPPSFRTIFILNPPFCNLVSDEVSLFVMWSQWQLSRDGVGRHYGAGVLPFGSQRKRARWAQWQFGGSSPIPALCLRGRERDGDLGSIPTFLWWLLASPEIRRLMLFLGFVLQRPKVLVYVQRSVWCRWNTVSFNWWGNDLESFSWTFTVTIFYFVHIFSSCFSW